MIAGFHHSVNEVCALLEFYVALNVSFIPMFQDNLLVPSYRVKGPWNTWPLKVVPIGCPAMSVQNCHSLLRKIPKEQTSQVIQIWVVTVSVQAVVFIIIVERWALCTFVRWNPYCMQGQNWYYFLYSAHLLSTFKWCQHILLSSVTVLVHGRRYFCYGCKQWHAHVPWNHMTFWSTEHFGEVCILHNRIHLQTCKTVAGIVYFQILFMQFCFIAQSYNVDSIREYVLLCLIKPLTL